MKSMELFWKSGQALDLSEAFSATRYPMNRILASKAEDIATFRKDKLLGLQRQELMFHRLRLVSAMAGSDLKVFPATRLLKYVEES